MADLDLPQTPHQFRHLSAKVLLDAELKAALLNVDDEILTGLPTAGYVERPESFYDVVRRIVPKASN